MTKTDVAGTIPRGMSPTRTPPPQPAAAALLPSTAIELALQGIDRVLWSCMGKRAKIVEGVEDAETAADAIRGGSGYVISYYKEAVIRGGMKLLRSEVRDISDSA